MDHISQWSHFMYTFYVYLFNFMYLYMFIFIYLLGTLYDLISLYIIIVIIINEFIYLLFYLVHFVLDNYF